MLPASLELDKSFVQKLTIQRWTSVIKTAVNTTASLCDSGVPRNFVRGGGSTNSVEDRENGDLGGGSPLVRGSGGSCNLVQEISFHTVKFS